MSKVVVYSSLLCPYCYRAKQLLERKGVEFEEIDLMASPSRRAEMTKRAGGRTSVPQIFIGEQHVGGCEELYALEARGELDGLLAGSAA